MSNPDNVAAPGGTKIKDTRKTAGLVAAMIALVASIIIGKSCCTQPTPTPTPAPLEAGAQPPPPQDAPLPGDDAITSVPRD